MESANDTLNKKHKHSKDEKSLHTECEFMGGRLLGQLLSIILGSSS
jgi:hypothetical protein